MSINLSSAYFQVHHMFWSTWVCLHWWLRMLWSYWLCAMCGRGVAICLWLLQPWWCQKSWSFHHACWLSSISKGQWEDGSLTCTRTSFCSQVRAPPSPRWLTNCVWACWDYLKFEFLFACLPDLILWTECSNSKRSGLCFIRTVLLRHRIIHTVHTL